MNVVILGATGLVGHGALYADLRDAGGRGDRADRRDLTYVYVSGAWAATRAVRVTYAATGWMFPLLRKLMPTRTSRPTPSAAPCSRLPARVALITAALLSAGACISVWLVVASVVIGAEPRQAVLR